MDSPQVFETDAQKILLNSDGSMTSTIAGDDTVIRPDSVESITVEDDTNVVLIRHSGGTKEPYFASSQGEATEVGSEIARHFGLGNSVRSQQTALEAGIIPGSYFLMALVATILLGFAAFSEGGDGPRAGKARMIKGLVDTLGPTGVLTIGGVLTVGTFGFLCYKLIYRRFKTVYTRD